MTNADLLSRMEILDAELETGSGEDDETKALLALDIAQDHFEAIAATYPRVFGTHDDTLTTTANTEKTTKPATILRLDSVWYLDTTVTPNIPRYKLESSKDSGGHIPGLPWPTRAQVGMCAGAPDGYWDDEDYFYWSPVPDAVYTLRWYGMKSQAAITARGTTFAYKDHLAMPFATFAVRAIKVGLEDGSDALKALAEELFAPALRRARRASRERVTGRSYTRMHVT